MAKASRQFRMHPKLLLDVIKRQAGTIQKAVLEGVMNSIEAGATKVDVGLDARKVTIRDDGRGFRNAQEIEDWFGTFGQPHAESEGKKWAQFRMGRGQMFAFGRNDWRTGEFRMRVDVESWANSEDVLGYDLESGLDAASGCSIDIDLYEPISDREIHGIAREIEKYVKFVEIPVQVNGRQVNSDPRGQKWGPESFDSAHVRLTDSSRGLEVYNLGVYVKTFPQWEFGVSGVVVSREKLDVNFARNDVVRSCKVWKAIRERLDKSERATKVKAKKVLTNDERLSLIDKLGAGELTREEAVHAKLLVDASGRPWSPRAIAQAKFVTWTTAPRGDKKADKLLQSKTCLALDEEVVAEFDCERENLFTHKWTERHDNDSPRQWRSSFSLLDSWRHDLRFVPLADAVKGIEGKSIILHESDWTEREHVWIDIAQDIQHSLRRHGDTGRYCHSSDDGGARKLVIGSSDVAEGWTDGSTFIALAREWLKKHEFERFDRPCVRGLTELAFILAHEMCHDDDSEGAPHSPEFYQEVHDLCHRALAKSVDEAVRFLTPKKIGEVKERAKKAHAKAKRSAKRPPAAKETPKPQAEKPKAARAAAAPGGLTASMLDQETLRRVHEAREGGASWSQIERQFGLRPANGMTAVHAYKRFEKG